ncbi:hypothetical protein [[Ruminococcus] lactaris]|uniref:hypothetical protein n=1 Tax=[Ruminococcus] lactaris TaxID=46228 RepID=UPI00242B23D8|nr:hypothetical protein [[Ruminococcus] lactaris]
MSRQRRNFSAKFKSDLVIELLKGEKISTPLQTENNIQQICSAIGRKNSLTMPLQYSMTSVRNSQDASLLKNARKGGVCEKVGQLTMQVDWLKKKSEEICGPDYESKFSPKPF